MSGTTRGRKVTVGQVIYDQADYLAIDGFSRISGLTTSDLVMELFFNNAPQAWVFVDGTTVTDAQVVSGYVYFNEIPGEAGYYNVRFRPNAQGYWRLELTYTAGTQRLAQDYDAEGAPVSTAAPGLRASFVKPGSSSC